MNRVPQIGGAVWVKGGGAVGWRQGGLGDAQGWVDVAATSGAPARRLRARHGGRVLWHRPTARKALTLNSGAASAGVVGGARGGHRPPALPSALALSRPIIPRRCAAQNVALAAVALISIAPAVAATLIPKVDGNKEAAQPLLLCFAAGGMLGDVFLHLMPHLLSPLDEHHHHDEHAAHQLLFCPRTPAPGARAHLRTYRGPRRRL